MERYYRATSIADACDQLATDRQTELIAGGQTLTLHLREGLKNPDRLVDISRIDDLTRIVDHGDRIGIGSAVTYERLRRSSVVREAFPLLVDAVDHIAGPPVRANGTVGGGLCYGDPALDAPPVLLTLDAELTLRRRDGHRTLPLAEFYTGYLETARAPDELLTEITVPKLPPATHGSYRTMTPRQGDYAIAGVAVRATFDGEACRTVRLALTNGGDTPARVREAESFLEGTDLAPAVVDRAVDAVRRSLDLVGDAQVPVSYQETVFGRLAAQAIRDVRADRQTAGEGDEPGEHATDGLDDSDGGPRDR